LSSFVGKFLSPYRSKLLSVFEFPGPATSDYDNVLLKQVFSSVLLIQYHLFAFWVGFQFKTIE